MRWLVVGLAVVVAGPLAARSEAARYVYVANSAVPAGGNVSQYAVGAGGLLAPLIPPTVPAGTFPLGIAVSPDAKSVYVANADSDTVSQYDVGVGGGLAPKSLGSVPARDSPSSIAVSPGGGSVYVTNTIGGDISQYDVGAGGALTAKRPAAVPAGRGPFAVAVNPDGRGVYVVNTHGNTVSQYDVGTAGVLTPKTPAEVPTGDIPGKIAVSPDGDSVYVTNVESSGVLGTVSQFDVGPDGALTPKNPPKVATGRAPQGLAVSTDGSVYVANNLGGSISQYTASPSGALTPKSPPTVGAPSPVGVAVSGDAASAYVTTSVIDSNEVNTVSQFDIGAGGVLLPKDPPTVAAGFGAGALAVSPAVAEPGPTSTRQCKNGGWRSFGDIFVNQGDCVSFVATGGKNPPANSS